MKSVLFTLVMGLSSIAGAAALCPKDSCNPYNGCVEGCVPFEVRGEATCTNRPMSDSVADAKANGYAKAYAACQYGVAQYSDWAIAVISDRTCTVTAVSQFACFQ